MEQKDCSLFEYKISNVRTYVKNLKETISEELNKGLHFEIRSDKEVLIKLAGKYKEWAEIETKDDLLTLKIKDEFFVGDSIIEQILTTLWHNLQDFCDARLLDFHLSDTIKRKLLEKRNRWGFHNSITNKGPFLGLIYKPSYSLTLDDRVLIAEKFIKMGGSFIKEDETFFVNDQELLHMAEIIQKSMSDLNENARYIPNITSKIHKKEFLNELTKRGIEIAMINFLITGLPTIQKIHNRNIKKLIFWGHRVGYSTISKSISMIACSKLAYYSNIGLIHVGTPFFTDKEKVREKQKIISFFNSCEPKMIPIFTKITPEIITKITKYFGQEIVLMASGSIRKNGEIDWKKISEIIKIIEGIKES